MAVDYNLSHLIYMHARRKVIKIVLNVKYQNNYLLYPRCN